MDEGHCMVVSRDIDIGKTSLVKVSQMETSDGGSQQINDRSALYTKFLHELRCQKEPSIIFIEDIHRPISTRGTSKNEIRNDRFGN